MKKKRSELFNMGWASGTELFLWNGRKPIPEEVTRLQELGPSEKLLEKRRKLRELVEKNGGRMF